MNEGLARAGLEYIRKHPECENPGRGWDELDGRFQRASSLFVEGVLKELGITEEQAGRGVNVGKAVGAVYVWCREHCDTMNMRCNECPVRVALGALGEDLKREMGEGT